jgi:hypothetical protein
MLRGTTRPTLIALSAILTLLLAACSGSSPTGVHEPLPEGWTRVQVREGYVGRDFSNPLAGFEIDLPPGWRAGEGWPGQDGPGGWIAAVAPPAPENVPILRFTMGHEPSHFPESENSVIKVAGALATIHLAPTEDGLGPNVGIYYEHIPGGPEGMDTPSLDIAGDNRGFDDQVLLTRVLTSIWYAEIDALPALPALGPPAGDDWVRTPAREGLATFTLLLPPGWGMESRQGIDSLVGVIEGPGTTLHYDFGAYGSAPYDHLSRVREHREEPGHETWEESAGDVRLLIARPASRESHPDSITGIFAHFAPAGGAGLHISGSGFNGDQQDIVLAILRSVALEAE